VAAVFGLVGGIWSAPTPVGPYLPQTPLFDLTRQSDMVIVGRVSSGDILRVEEVLGAKKQTIRSLNVANFGRLRRGLYQTTPPNSKEQLPPDAILFLRRYNDQWRILEMIPRARAANGCLWVRNNQVLRYSRNPWTNGPQLVEYSSVGPTRAQAGKKTTSSEVRDLLRGWQADLARLRQIDKMTSPIVQLRALRAFIVPSAKTAHSPEALALARRVYREVLQHVDALRDGKKPEPVANSAWLEIRPGPPASVLQSLAKTKSERASERLAGMQELAFAAAPEVAGVALKALAETSPTVRLAAANVLGDFADGSCSQTLIARFRAIKDTSDPMRRLLLRALATCEEPHAVAEMVLALQEPDDPMRDEVVQLLLWVSGYRPEKGVVPAIYTSAAWWSRWYEKRYAKKIELKPWDFARLESWIARRRGMPITLPASDWSQVPAKTIEDILNRCADSTFPNRARWCELLLQAWSAGALTPQHQRAFLNTFGRASLEGRSIYPLGTSAFLRVVSSWPAALNLPPTLRFISRSQVYVDGTPVGRSYPIATPMVFVSRLSPGDYGPGTHRLSIETEYAVRVGKTAAATTETVRTPELEFQVLFPNQQFDLQAKTDPRLDAQVERAFRFASVPDWPTTGPGTLVPLSMPRRARVPRRIPHPTSGGYLEVFGYNRWELTEKLPVDLAFDVQYEYPDLGLIVEGGPLYVPQGTTDTAEINPLAYRTKGFEIPGTYRFRVQLTPSRDVALSQPNSRAYWDGFILTSPEMRFRVAEVVTPPQKP
jgi:hypothetical protein